MVVKKAMYFSLLVLIVMLACIVNLNAKIIASETLTIWAYVPPRIEFGLNEFGELYVSTNLNVAHISCSQSNDIWQIVSVVAM